MGEDHSVGTALLVVDCRLEAGHWVDVGRSVEIDLPVEARIPEADRRVGVS